MSAEADAAGAGALRAVRDPGVAGRPARLGASESDRAGRGRGGVPVEAGRVRGLLGPALPRVPDREARARALLHLDEEHAADEGAEERSPGRGKYRRKRDRRPMVGMLLHLDASTHAWIEGVPDQDLVVMLDDADGRILFARFVEQEGTLSTLMALKHVLVRFGRFSELYTDGAATSAGRARPGKIRTRSSTGRWLASSRRSGSATSWRGRRRHAAVASGPSGPSRERLPQELRLAGIQTYPGRQRLPRTRPSSPASTSASR